MIRIIMIMIVMMIKNSTTIRCNNYDLIDMLINFVLLSLRNRNS